MNIDPRILIGLDREDVTPLVWLTSLLTEVRASGWPDTTEDPQAAWTALAESEHLAAHLRDAVAEHNRTRDGADAPSVGTVVDLTVLFEGDDDERRYEAACAEGE